MTPAVTMFIHEHDHILSLAALHANSRTKEKTEQKLHKLTPESSDLTERAEPRKKKNPTFEGWITGKMAVVLYLRKCEPKTARST
jgi:hypothetical protein